MSRVKYFFGSVGVLLIIPVIVIIGVISLIAKLFGLLGDGEDDYDL